MEANYREQEVEIDLLDLLYRVALKWRAMVVLGLVCAIVACAYKGYQNVKNNQNVDAYYEYLQLEYNYMEKEEEAEETGETLNAYQAAAQAARREALASAAQEWTPFSDLDDEEISDYYRLSFNYLDEEQVEDVEDAIYAYGSLMDKRAYEDDSLWVNLDYKAVGTGWVLYHIDTGHFTDYSGISQDDYRSAIIDAYVGYINNSPEIKGIDWSDDIRYIRQLFGIGAASDGNLYVQTYAKDEESAKALENAIREMLSSYTPVLSSEIGAHELVKISEIYNTQEITSVRDAMDAAMADIKAMEDTMDGYYAGFNIYQAARFYFDLQNTYEGEKVDFSDIIRMNATYVAKYNELSASVPERVSMISGMPKMAAIGFVVGVFLIIVLYALIYILDGRIKSGREISDMYGVYPLGSLEQFKYVNPKHHNPLDRWIYSWKNKDKATREERETFLLTNTKLTCEKAGVQSVVLGSTEKLGDAAAKLAEALRESLSGAGIEAEVAGDVVHDAGALEQASKSGNLVLIAQTDISKRADISAAMATVAMQKLGLVGVVSV